MGPDELVSAIREVLEPEGAVRLAYLFGSAASGRAGTDSDIDVAVRIESPDAPAVRRRLWGALVDRLHRDVDLLSLDDLPATVAWTAMQGRPVLVRDVRVALELSLALSAEAADFQRFLEDLWAWRERIARSRAATA